MRWSPKNGATVLILNIIEQWEGDEDNRPGRTLEPDRSRRWTSPWFQYMYVEWGWERWKERHWPIAIVKQLFIYTADSYSQPNKSWNRNELATIASAMSQYGKFSCAQILKLEEIFIIRVSEVLLEWYWYHATPSINQMLYRLRWLLVLLVLHTYYFANYESKWALAANSDATINIDNELELATKHWQHLPLR